MIDGEDNEASKGEITLQPCDHVLDALGLFGTVKYQARRSTTHQLNRADLPPPRAPLLPLDEAVGTGKRSRRAERGREEFDLGMESVHASAVFGKLTHGMIRYFSKRWMGKGGPEGQLGAVAEKRF